MDECTRELDNCHRETNATCTDTIGSFMCTCSPGFTGNGTYCTGVYKGMIIFVRNTYNFFLQILMNVLSILITAILMHSATIPLETTHAIVIWATVEMDSSVMVNELIYITDWNYYSFSL